MLLVAGFLASFSRIHVVGSPQAGEVDRDPRKQQTIEMDACSGSLTYLIVILAQATGRRS